MLAGVAMSKVVVKPAPTIEVLEEQFAFLAAHSMQGACKGCEDCRRFQAVKAILMRPFREDQCPTR